VLRKLRQNRGFTLIELLVVILLVGILAALAIPAYLSHQKKGKDSEAQSNARNLSSRVELCFATNEDYDQCATHEALGDDTNLPYGTGAGEVSIVSTTKSTYKITAVSRAKSDDSNHTFSIVHNASGTNDRHCTAGTTNANGACRNGVW
jgi:type IV pilus assembly protein PilA